MLAIKVDLVWYGSDFSWRCSGCGLAWESWICPGVIWLWPLPLVTSARHKIKDLLRSQYYGLLDMNKSAVLSRASLIDTWGVRVQQKMKVWSKECRICMKEKSSRKRGRCRAGLEYGYREEWLGVGDNLGLGWNVFTGDVLAVEYSGHWSCPRWWFGIKRKMFLCMCVQKKCTVRRSVYCKVHAQI